MPKNTEIERKFLVKSDAFLAQATHHYEIEQGYLCKEAGKTIRVRIRDTRAFLTIKSGKLRAGLAKFEFEHEIALDEAKELMQLCLPNPIIKTRYIIPISGERKWEVVTVEVVEVTAHDAKDVSNRMMASGNAAVLVVELMIEQLFELLAQ